MKKTLIITLIALAMAVPAMATDVTISVTVKSAHVSRLAAAVTNSCNCEKKIITPTETPILDPETGEPTGETEMVDVITYETMPPKQCVEAMIRKKLLDIVNNYERNLAEKQAQDAYAAMYQDWLDNKEDFVVEETE